VFVEVHALAGVLVLGSHEQALEHGPGGDEHHATDQHHELDGDASDREKGVDEAAARDEHDREHDGQADVVVRAADPEHAAVELAQELVNALGAAVGSGGQTLHRRERELAEERAEAEKQHEAANPSQGAAPHQGPITFCGRLRVLDVVVESRVGGFVEAEGTRAIEPGQGGIELSLVGLCDGTEEMSRGLVGGEGIEACGAGDQLRGTVRDSGCLAAHQVGELVFGAGIGAVDREPGRAGLVLFGDEQGAGECGHVLGKVLELQGLLAQLEGTSVVVARQLEAAGATQRGRQCGNALVSCFVESEGALELVGVGGFVGLAEQVGCLGVYFAKLFGQC